MPGESGIGPEVCPECATPHEPEEPHNLVSEFYHLRFRAGAGRWPTWTDAMSHCSPERQAAWRVVLEGMGWADDPRQGAVWSDTGRRGDFVPDRLVADAPMEVTDDPRAGLRDDGSDGASSPVRGGGDGERSVGGDDLDPGVPERDRQAGVERYVGSPARPGAGRAAGKGGGGRAQRAAPAGKRKRRRR